MVAATTIHVAVTMEGVMNEEEICKAYLEGHPKIDLKKFKGNLGEMVFKQATRNSFSKFVCELSKMGRIPPELASVDHRVLAIYLEEQNETQ